MWNADIIGTLWRVWCRNWGRILEERYQDPGIADENEVSAIETCEENFPGMGPHPTL